MVKELQDHQLFFLNLERPRQIIPLQTLH